MNTTTCPTTELQNLVARISQMLPSGCNGSGEPSRRICKIVNGHRVMVWGFGFDADRIVFEVDGSTEPLSLRAAAELVA